jgi:hypothetical protein
LLDQKGEKKSSSLEALLFEHRFKKQLNFSQHLHKWDVGKEKPIASLFDRYAASERIGI